MSFFCRTNERTMKCIPACIGVFIHSEMIGMLIKKVIRVSKFIVRFFPVLHAPDIVSVVYQLGWCRKWIHAGDKQASVIVTCSSSRVDVIWVLS